MCLDLLDFGRWDRNPGDSNANLRPLPLSHEETSSNEVNFKGLWITITIVYIHPLNGYWELNSYMKSLAYTLMATRLLHSLESSTLYIYIYTYMHIHSHIYIYIYIYISVLPARYDDDDIYILSQGLWSNISQKSRCTARWSATTKKENRFSLNRNGIMSFFLGRQFYRSAP